MCLYCNAICKCVLNLCLVLFRGVLVLPAIKLPGIVFAIRFLAFWICYWYFNFLIWIYPECLVKLSFIRCLVCSLYKYLNIILWYIRFLVRIFLLDYIRYKLCGKDISLIIQFCTCLLYTSPSPRDTR